MEEEAALLDRVRSNDPTLTSVSLNTRNSMVHIMAVIKALKLNTEVQKLEFYKCSLQASGCIKVFDMLNTNTTISTLDIKITPLTSAGVEKVLTQAARNNSLMNLGLSYMRLNSMSGPLIGAVLQNIRTLQVLSLQGNALRDAGLAGFVPILTANQAMLLELHLDRNEIEDANHQLATMLRSNTTLRILGLPNNKLQDAGTVEVARSMQFNTSLCSLNLQANDIHDTGAIELGQVTSLKTLDLAKNVKIGREGCRAVAHMLTQNTVLTDLNLMDTPKYHTSIILTPLQTNTTLKHLCLFGNNGYINWCPDLCNMLRVNSTLTNLRLGYNWFKNEQCTMIAEALAENKTLQTIDLEGCECRSGADPLVIILTQNTSLLSVTFSNQSFYNLNDKEVVKVANALATNKSLRSFNLYGSEFHNGEESGQAFKSALKTNTHLRSLSLMGSSFRSNTLSLIFNGMCSNTGLTSLNVSTGYFDVSNDELTGIAMAEMLSKNRTLTHLDAKIKSDWSNEVGIAVVDALKINPVIKSLMFNIPYAWSFETRRSIAQLLRAREEAPIYVKSAVASRKRKHSELMLLLL